jgi:hypothetical protein
VVPTPGRVGLALVPAMNLALVTAAIFTLTTSRGGAAQPTVRSRTVEAVSERSVRDTGAARTRVRLARPPAGVRLGRCEVLFGWDEC